MLDEREGESSTPGGIPAKAWSKKDDPGYLQWASNCLIEPKERITLVSDVRYRRPSGPYPTSTVCNAFSSSN
jgi:hypothetical protein